MHSLLYSQTDHYKVKIIIIVISLVYHIQAENQLNLSFYDSLIPHAQATVDDDEDDEGDDDCFVPRKLFLFSFAHFKVSAILCLICVLFFIVCFLFFFGGGGLYTKSD